MASVGEEPLCRNWAALRRALADGRLLAYEYDKREVHVWPNDPQPGDRCQCGDRAWT